VSNRGHSKKRVYVTLTGRPSLSLLTHSHYAAVITTPPPRLGRPPPPSSRPCRHVVLAPHTSPHSPGHTSPTDISALCRLHDIVSSLTHPTDMGLRTPPVISFESLSLKMLIPVPLSMSHPCISCFSYIVKCFRTINRTRVIKIGKS
jgi:hypothetical protein